MDHDTTVELNPELFADPDTLEVVNGVHPRCVGRRRSRWPRSPSTQTRTSCSGSTLGPENEKNNHQEIDVGNYKMMLFEFCLFRKKEYGASVTCCFFILFTTLLSKLYFIQINLLIAKPVLTLFVEHKSNVAFRS